MTYNLTNPKLLLRFEGNDLEPGHGLVQTIESDFIYNRSFSGRFLRLSQMRSSSDQISLQIKRLCPSIEDIIATEGNIKAVLKDGEETVFTGYLSTNWKWSVTDHGERALAVTVEGVGTRLLNQPFIETGKHFFRCSASAAIYAIVEPLGITIHAGDERKVLQDVSKDVSAGTTRRELLDQLLYECNAYYWFDNLGEMRIDLINPQTIGAPVLDSSDLYNVFRESVTLSKNLRSYKGARVKYTVLAEADNYLVYRNTTGQDSSHPYCNLELKAGEYFDGTEIYSAAEWAEAQADEFREPALIGAVNADSESQIVGSNKIVNIDNLQPEVVGAGMTCVFENVGGGYFKLTAHNESGGARQFTRMDLYASIVYEKSQGVVRTQIDGSSAGKTLIEESLEWIHDKDNASAHANLVSQYHQNANASYTFWAKTEIMPGTVIRLNEDLYSGLDVYVLVIGYEVSAGVDCYKYTAVGISTFDLTEPTYHGTSQPANQSGAQGPAGEPGQAAQIQYAIGDSIVNPPADEMLWNSVTMEWDGDPMLWQTGLWGDDVPDMKRGKYIWMRTRVGDSPWQYTRLTGSTSWDAENLGVYSSACPTTSKEGLGLIPGDYFVAGATFTDTGIEYKKGYAYTYSGSGWSVMDLTNPANSGKALQCLSSLISSGINVTDSTASIWGWFQNLVAQNAVIENLTANTAFIQSLASKNIKILSNGCIYSDYYNADGTINPNSSATKGFWLGANGELKCYSAALVNANVSGSITANSFAFDNVAMKWGYFETNSTININLTENYGANQGDLVVVNAGWLKNTSPIEPFANATFSFILEDGARSISYDSVLVNQQGVQISYIRGVEGSGYIDGYGIRVVPNGINVKLFVQVYHRNT